MTTTAAILSKAANLLEKKGWTKGAYARCDDGKDVLYANRRAVKFCVNGAIYRAAAGDFPAASDAIDELSKIIGPATIDWNDRQKSKHPVIAALRKAAKLAAK